MNVNTTPICSRVEAKIYIWKQGMLLYSWEFVPAEWKRCIPKWYCCFVFYHLHSVVTNLKHDDRPQIQQSFPNTFSIFFKRNTALHFLLINGNFEVGTNVLIFGKHYQGCRACRGKCRSNYLATMDELLCKLISYHLPSQTVIRQLL